MKKLILTILFLAFSSIMLSQTFVKKYTSVISEKAGVVGKWEETSLTVVFYDSQSQDIVFYYMANNSTKRFHQISTVIEGKTESEEGYQMMVCIDDEDGTKVAIQLFNDDTTLRVLISEGYFVEFHK